MMIRIMSALDNVQEYVIVDLFQRQTFIPMSSMKRVMTLPSKLIGVTYKTLIPFTDLKVYPI